jgi:hypothetical protein
MVKPNRINNKHTQPNTIFLYFEPLVNLIPLQTHGGTCNQIDRQLVPGVD